MDTFQNITGRSHAKTLRILLFFLSETYADTHSQDSCGKDSSKKHWWNLVGKQYQIGNACLLIENNDYSYRVFVDDIKMAGRPQKMSSMWKKLMKDVDSLLRECKTN